MGARPSSFRKGGGFLNNVDGVITGYEFTDTFPGNDGKPAPKGKKRSDFRSLYFVLTARVDGADEDLQTTLFAGDADQFEISEDRHTLTPSEEGYNLGATTGVGKFISSLVDSGFPETNLPEDEINFEAIVGTRVRFVQRTDVEATKKYGKRKSKDGKREYDRQDLVIDQVYSLPEAEEAPAPTKPGAKGSKPAAAAKPAKGKPADTAANVDELASETLLTILADNKGKIAKSKLSLKVLNALMKHPQREEVRKRVFSDDFLGQKGQGWTYDPTDKNQTISLDE